MEGLLNTVVLLTSVGVLLCLAALVSKRARKLFLGRRLVAVGAMILLLALGLPAVHQATELRLEHLRQTDPEGYLNELHTLRTRDGEWLQALRELHPDRYEAEIARREVEDQQRRERERRAAEEEQQRREREARAAEEALRATEARRQNTPVSAPPVVASGATAPTGIAAISAAGWEVQLWNDPMDRTARTQVIRSSEASVEGFAGRRIYPSLAFRCEVPPGRPARWSTWMGFEDGTLAQVSGTPVRYRFDEGSISRETWQVWADNKGLWTSSTQFIARASQARRLHVEWWPYMGAPRYASFDLTEVAAAIRTVGDACGARPPGAAPPQRR
jgi:hypothetical protein